jgi:FkbM family methyltransferase
MRLLGALNRLFPECRLKYVLKNWFLHRVLFRVTGRPRTQALKDGVTIRYYPLLFARADMGDFELIGYEKHYSLRPGDVVVDGGGFLGLFALYAATKVGPTGRVITYEPDPALANLLERNVALNGLTNVTVVRKGLWSSTTELYFDTRGNAGTIDFKGERGRVLVQKISVASLDDEVERLQLARLDLIKMNIEGAEIEAAEGCRQLMERFPVHFVIAANHYRDGEQTARRVQEALARGGYETMIDYPAHLSVYAWPRKPAGTGAPPVPTDSLAGPPR